MKRERETAAPAGNGVGRLILIVAALVPAAVNLLKAPIAAAGSGAWLCPLLALPVGLILCWGLEGSGPTLDGTGVERNRFPMGTFLLMLYLVWGLVLLFFGTVSYSQRLLLGLNGMGSRPLFLAVSALLVLYLGRSDSVLLRASRLFFPVLILALGAGLLMAFPAIRWENLDPLGPQGLGEKGGRGLFAGAGQILSLTGYAVFAQFLPQKGSLLQGFKRVPSEKGATWRQSRTFWVVVACAALSALLLAMLGTFGVNLTLRMDEPFLYLMGGAGLASGLRRGEAVLATLVAVGDLTLLALLSRGCGELWASLFARHGPVRRWGYVPAAAAMLAPLLLPEGWFPEIWERIVLPTGNLILGIAIPLLAILNGRKAGTE